MKRRNTLEDPPSLVSLDDLSGDSSQSEAETDLPSTLQGADKPSSTQSVDEKVDTLINRMDKFLDCFNIIQKKAAKKEKSDSKKFKCLEAAHNDLIAKVITSSTTTDSRLDSLEERLARSEDLNKDLSDKLASLEANYDRNVAMQHSINAENQKKITSVEMNQGHTDKNVLDLASEVKVRKIIISRVHEDPNEDVSTTALECINSVINAAILDTHPDASLNGLKILMPNAIDHVFRIGKPRRGNYRRNISVTFARFDDKDMVIRARAATKDNEDIKFFISDDLTPDGRALKAELKRISSVAKSQGLDTKVSGNKVTVESRSYASNELSLIPTSVKSDLKQEKIVAGGIAYKGDRSIFSNFFPAPFKLGGEDYAHVEQYYQHTKAVHHGEDAIAERILKLSNPWRIKVLGDSIEQKDSWLPERMKTLYEGVSAKFKQNWPLQDELLKSKGHNLFEATTDLYFACGIGFDSKRWDAKDWIGENVAGLVVMKVRDEILQEVSGNIAICENTLTQIAADQGDSHGAETEEMLYDSSPLESTCIRRDTPDVNKGNTSRSASSQTTSYTDAVKSPIRKTDEYPPLSQRGRAPHNRRSYGNNRGRGRLTSQVSIPSYTSTPSFNRGRGRGSRRPYHRNYPVSQRPQDRMSAGDKNFLYGKQTTRKTD